MPLLKTLFTSVCVTLSFCSQMLPICSHTFHTRCLENLASQQPDCTIKCPDCGETYDNIKIEELPPNIWISQTLDGIKQQNQEGEKNTK